MKPSGSAVGWLKCQETQVIARPLAVISNVDPTPKTISPKLRIQQSPCFKEGSASGL